MVVQCWTTPADSHHPPMPEPGLRILAAPVPPSCDLSTNIPNLVKLGINFGAGRDGGATNRTNCNLYCHKGIFGTMQKIGRL
jgi:hypothetical protein